MSLRATLEPVTRLFRERTRRSFLTEERAHVEFAGIGRDELPAFDRALRERTRDDARVAHVEINAATRRVVFAFERGSCSLAELYEHVVHAERAAGVATPRFEGEPEHPADVEVALRRLLGFGADAAAFFAGLGLSVLPIPVLPFATSSAAVLSLVEGVDRLRAVVEDKIGKERAELFLDLATAFLTGLAQRPLTSFVDALHKLTILRETEAHRATWARLEPKLSAGLGDRTVGTPRGEVRPMDLPRGPIEDYAERTWIVSLAGFAVSFATTRSLQRAIAALYGSLPRPARVGRDVFGAELGRIFADRDAVVLDSDALRRLDRIDCVVLRNGLVASRAFALGAVHTEEGVDALALTDALLELFDPDRPLVEQTRGDLCLRPWRLSRAGGPQGLEETARNLSRRGALVLALERDGHVVAAVEIAITPRTGLDELVTAAHEAGMRVVMESSDEAIFQSVGADDVITPEEGIRAGIRRLQREGRGVCFVSAGDSPGLAIADVGVGLCRTGASIPWGAHLLVPDDLTEVRLLLRACARAREVSKQSVNIALGAAAFGALVSAGGKLPLTTRRVMFVVNSGTLMAMANGVRGSIAVRRLALPPSRDPTPWHALDADGVLARLSSTQDGLTRTDALLRRSPKPAVPTSMRELVEAFTDELFSPLAPLLAAGAGLSAAVGSTADAAMVGGVVGLSALFGGVQRVSAERKLRSLARAERRTATVRRDERLDTLDASELVPGDVILLSTGDVVPADCRILESTALEVDASSLTGESLPVRKFSAPSFENQAADRTSMVYEGTTIAAGHTTAVVVAVGEHTEARRGATSSKGTRGAGGVERRLTGLMALTGPIALAAGVGVVGGGMLRGRRLDELVGSGVSLAVASVPEGLPLLATVAQLSAAERLSVRGAIVRNPRAIEALGRVDVVCLDKTGTVTHGALALSTISDGDLSAPVDDLGPLHRAILAAGVRATGRPHDGSRTHDPTDAALLAAAATEHVEADYGCPGFVRQSELSLSFGRSYLAVLGKSDTGTRLSVKGAPEVLLLQCADRVRSGAVEPLDEASRLALFTETTRIAARGLRVLAVAERPMPNDAELSPEHVVDLTFLGFLAFRDPLRPRAAEAILGMKRAGVRPLMITGDHPSTAEAIAAELGLPAGGSVVTGAELAALGDAELDRRIDTISVFARVTPSQKVRVVRALQRANHVVAMAGDGANDAAAIRLADVGIAVGEGGTEAARSAADLIVTDGRVETIVDAIIEGRGMWASVRDAVSILMGGNLGEIGFTLLAGLIDGSPALHARQLLLVNLLTDIAPAMAIAVRPPSPRKFESLAHQMPESALGASLDREIAARAIVTAVGAGSAWAIGRIIASRPKARTMGLAALVGTQLGQTLTSGDFSRPVVLTSVASAGALALLIQTPGVSHFFGCRPLGPIAWTTTVGASIAATAMAGVVERFLGDNGALKATDIEMPAFVANSERGGLLQGLSTGATHATS